jgi:hypothetical protein
MLLENPRPRQDFAATTYHVFLACFTIADIACIDLDDSLGITPTWPTTPSPSRFLSP